MQLHRRTELRPVLATIFVVATCIFRAAAAAPSASPTAPAVLLTNLQQVLALSNEALSKTNYAVRARAVITYVPPQSSRLYIQDGDAATYLDAAESTNERKAGEIVEFNGSVQRGFLVPRVVAKNLHATGFGPLPEAKPAAPARLAVGEDAMRFVRVRGVVRDLMVLSRHNLMLLVVDGATTYRVFVKMRAASPIPRELLDATIEASGMSRPISDNYGNAFGFVLYQASPELTTVIRPGTPQLFDRPLLTIREAAQATNNSPLRIKIAGTVLAHIPGKTLFIQDTTSVARVELLSLLPKPVEETQQLEHEPQTQLQPGERVEVIGVADAGFALTPGFKDGEFRRVGSDDLPPARPVSIHELESGQFAGHLVTLKAHLLDQRTTSVANTWHQWVVLETDGRVFQARWEGEKPLRWNLEPDRFVQITGVNDVESGDLKKARTFHLLLRSPEDIVLTTSPPLWMRPDVQRVTGIIAAILLLAAGWIAYERRQFRRMRAADEAAKRSEAVTRTINYFATSLLERDTEDDVLWDLAKNCISQIGFADCVIYRLDRAQKILFQKAALGPKNPEGRVILNPITVPLGKGIVGTVAATGRPELIADTSCDPRYIVDDEVRFSELAVPIIANGEVIGVIDSEHPSKNFFTPEHLQMLTSVASLCANKLVRIQAEQKLRQSYQELEKRIADRTVELRAANERLTREVGDRTRAEKVQRALYVISEAVHGVDDLPSLYQRIHEITGSLMPAENFYIALYDPANDLVSFPYFHDRTEPSPAPRRGGRGLTEFVLRENQPLLVTLEDTEALVAKGQCAPHGRLAKIWLGVPLISGGQPFGVMAVQDYENQNVYREEERQILGFVAEQTALAIERKQAEHDLKLALQAEKELNQLKSSFVSMVSHEFRTPLEVILSSSNILDRYLDRLPPEKRTAQLRAIRRSVHRMNDLIDDVLLLGKFDAGALCCQPVPLDLPAFCERAANEIESAANRENAIRFLSTDDISEATADEGLLQHILTNLLGNAVKYSRPNEVVDFELRRSGTDAQFIIRDRGCGIPKADQARLFTAFYRGSNVGKTSGSGLGLVIAKRCVDLHGGTIACESEQGVGTTFTVTLPLFDGTRIFRRRPSGEIAAATFATVI